MVGKRKKKEEANIPVTKLSDFKGESNTILFELLKSIKKRGEYAKGDQRPPCVILWTDPDNSWNSIIESLKEELPELYILGDYAPEKRTGPAIWLKCIDARLIGGSPGTDKIPIFYLPNVSRQELQNAKDCPQHLQPLVELQYRGVIWTNPNGDDWTPYSFLSSELQLEIAADETTRLAIIRALPVIMEQNAVELTGLRIDAGFINGLIFSNMPKEILSWMNDPEKERSKKMGFEWETFCEEARKTYKFDPEKDGQLKAGELLGNNKDRNWTKIWELYRESPKKYSNIMDLLNRSTSQKQTKFMVNEDRWPKINEEEEIALSTALKESVELSKDKLIEKIQELEKNHSKRRCWVWAELGHSELAISLEHLNKLAKITENAITASTLEEYAKNYTTSGYMVDSEAIEALCCCSQSTNKETIKKIVRRLYGEWLEESTNNFQTIIKKSDGKLSPIFTKGEIKEGTVIIFADGLRYDLAMMLKNVLDSSQLDPNFDS